MSARLIQALGKGKVVVRNTGSSEVLVQHPACESNPDNFTIVPPMGKVNLTESVPVKVLRKSANLKQLLRDGFLTIVE